MLDLLYYRTADRVNKLRLRDYEKRCRKLARCRDDHKRALAIGRSCDYQRGLASALKQLRSECTQMTRELAKKDEL